MKQQTETKIAKQIWKGCGKVFKYINKINHKTESWWCGDSYKGSEKKIESIFCPTCKAQAIKHKQDCERSLEFLGKLYRKLRFSKGLFHSQLPEDYHDSLEKDLNLMEKIIEDKEQAIKIHEERLR